MPSNTSVVSLVNRSLLSIGARAQVSSISPSDGSTAADAASVLFTPTYEALARSAYWNCLQKEATLSLLAAAQGTPENPTGTPPLPPQPWLYQYALPPDCLKARAIIPTFPAQGTGGPPLTTVNNSAGVWIRGQGQIPFQVAYATDSQNNPITVILTNQDQAQLTYTVNQPNPVIWDSQFQSAFVASLAAYLVPALSLHLPLMSAQISIAERIIAEARAADANEGTNSQDREADWIAARNGGGFSSWGWGSAYGNCENMSWPC